jgi:uncharacterized protein
MAENLYTTDCIRTFTGIYVNVFEPTEDMICIEDIAHALSHQCRFGGHLPKFYSVAKHSILCAQLARRDEKLAALLHDSAEAYLLDVPTPIKRRLSGYKDIEDKLMALIAKKFGFSYPLAKEIKDIDARMLQLEWDYLMLKTPISTTSKAEQVLQEMLVDYWTPEESKNMFLMSFKNLVKNNL